MTDYIESEKLPEYHTGDWLSQDEWMDKGVEDIFEYAEGLEPGEFEEVTEGYYGLQAVNDFGAERIIPLEYDSRHDEFQTVRGVFDSNPGKTQRYTPWDHSYTPEKLNEELDETMEHARLIQLNEEHVEKVRENFPAEGEQVDLSPGKAIISGLTTFLSDL